MWLLTDVVIEAKQGAAEFCVPSKEEAARSQPSPARLTLPRPATKKAAAEWRGGGGMLHTLISLHNDPYPGADTLVDEL